MGLFGNIAFVPINKKYSFILNQRVGKVIPNKEKVDLYDLYYLLETKSVKEQLEFRSSGTRQRDILPERIRMNKVVCERLKEYCEETG